MKFKVLILTLSLLLGFGQAFGSSPSRQFGSSMYFTELGHLRHKAELGDANAQFLLGNLYLQPPQGLRIRKNLNKAVDYYEKAALRAHVGAQYNLGVLYFRGTGVEQSQVMAFVWFSIAADNKSPASKNVKRNALLNINQIKPQLTEQEQKQAQEWIKQVTQLIEKKDFRKSRLPKIH